MIVRAPAMNKVTSPLHITVKPQSGQTWINRLLLLAGSAFMIAQPLHATLVVTYAESPTAVNSTVAHTSVINFDSLATSGANSYTNLTWTDSTLGTVGSIDQVYLQTANQYGGANYTPGTTPTGYYPVQSNPPSGVGAGKAVATTTLTFNTPSAYFGIWWSAGDAKNVLTFYDGSTQIAQYTTASLPGLLPGTYFGNPVDKKADSAEPFAFLNFYALEGAQFTKVVFSNNGTSGFESDNWTVRSQPYGYYSGESTSALPGVLIGTAPVPEPSTTAALGLSALLMTGVLMRRRRA